MSPNILVTGAAGYIGGSIVADFLARSLFKKEQVNVVVRSDEQAQALSSLGINVLRFELTDANAVAENLARYNINIVINTATAIDAALALSLITALGKQKEASREETYFIHTSGLSAFCSKTGWPPEQTKDTDPIFEVEKRLADSFPVRKTDVSVIEHAKAVGVTSFIVVPCHVYGRGRGPWNQLSVVLPICIQTSISTGEVCKFPESIKASGVHISDLTALYGLIVERILSKQPIESGTKGYYFAIGHDIYWWEVMDRLAATLDARGLVKNPNVQVWPNDGVAAKTLGVPVPFMHVLWNAGDNLVASNEERLGWKPKWDKERFLESIDGEIQDVLDLGKAKSSLLDSLFKAVKG